jgi:hypothetical protein
LKVHELLEAAGKAIDLGKVDGYIVDLFMRRWKELP